MARATAEGLGVSKPYGDSAQYDVAVDYGGRFRRVQVKSTIYRRRDGRSYSLNVLGPGRQRYGRHELDFVAVYLIPEDTWYIFPFDVVAENCSLHFTMGGQRQKYGRYREAWELLKGQEQR